MALALVVFGAIECPPILCAQSNKEYFPPRASNDKVPSRGEEKGAPKREDILQARESSPTITDIKLTHQRTPTLDETVSSGYPSQVIRSKSGSRTKTTLPERKRSRDYLAKDYLAKRTKVSKTSTLTNTILLFIPRSNNESSLMF